MIKGIFSILLFISSWRFSSSIYEHDYGKIVPPQILLRLRGRTVKTPKSKSPKSSLPKAKSIKKCKEWIPNETSKGGSGRLTKSTKASGVSKGGKSSKGNKAETSKGGKSSKSSKSSKSRKSDKYCSEAPSISISPSPSSIPSIITADPSTTPTFITSSPSDIPSNSPTKFCSSASGRDEIIGNIAREISGSAVDELGSSANNALSWILNDTADVPDGCNEDLITQRYALAVLYYSTGGDSWKNKTKWLTGDHCNWNGINCVDDVFVGGIDLRENNLAGTIPKEVGVFSELKNFTLYDNLLQGSIPFEIFNLTIEIIDLESNQLNGKSLPDEIFLAAGTLRRLKISDNFFDSYNLPTYIEDMSNLLQLWVANSSLTGKLPTEISQVSSLKSFIASDNSLTGPIPNMNTLENLTRLQLDHNKLTSTIPLLPESLEILRLSDNNLIGQVPSFLGNFENLRNITLGNNTFDGPLPTGFSDLKFLISVELQMNRFTGIMPNFGQSTNLTSIDLSYNLFNGTIPSDVFELNKLEVLYLNNNTFSGSIPENLGNAKSLRDLYLYSNLLTGTIPNVSSDSFPNITEFLVNLNFLTGSISSRFCELRNSTLENLHADCTVVCECCSQCFPINDRPGDCLCNDQG